MSSERRAYSRHGVFAGSAEITMVLGALVSGNSKRNDRARILNWSRGGMLLRVPSPRRRFFVIPQEPCLSLNDGVVCTLRLPPVYQEIDGIQGDIVRVGRPADEPDTIDVGIRFDSSHTPQERLDTLAKLLEPRDRSKRLRAISSRRLVKK